MKNESLADRKNQEAIRNKPEKYKTKTKKSKKFRGRLENEKSKTAKLSSQLSADVNQGNPHRNELEFSNSNRDCSVLCNGRHCVYAE